MSDRRKSRLVPREDEQDITVIGELKHAEDQTFSRKRRRILSASDNDSSFLASDVTDIFTLRSQIKEEKKMFSTAKFYGENSFKSEISSNSDDCYLENNPTVFGERYPNRIRKPAPKKQYFDESWTPEKTNPNSKGKKMKKVNKKFMKKPVVEKATTNIKEESQSEDEPEMSEFQLMRKRNIEERMRLFNELKLNEARDDLVEEVAKKVKLRPSKISISQEVLPLRQSLRVRNVKAEEPPEETTTTSRSATSSFPALNIWGRKQRNKAAVLPMCESVLKNFSQDECRRIVSSFLQEENKPADCRLESCSLREFKASVDQLTLREQHKMKVVPSRIYSLAFHPTSYLIAAGCKSGALGLWRADPERSEWDDSQVVSFDYHTAPVSCVSFSDSQPHVLYTTSYDGTLRRGDLNCQEFSLVHATKEDERANHLAWHCELDAHTLLVGRGDGNLARLDLRESPAKTKLFRCHDRSVRTVSLHPVSRQHVATTSSSKRLVSLWDLRRLGVGKELATLEFRKPLSSAFFSPLTGDRLLTTSYDDNLSVFSCSDLAKPTLGVRVNHCNQTGRWVTNFKAVWHPRREDVFLVGSMERPRRLEIFKADGGKVLSRLREPDLFTTIGAVAAFHPSLPGVVAGNASGYLHLFV